MVSFLDYSQTPIIQSAQAVGNRGLVVDCIYSITSFYEVAVFLVGLFYSGLCYRLCLLIQVYLTKYFQVVLIVYDFSFSLGRMFQRILLQ